MHKLFILLAAAALIHVGRSQSTTTCKATINGVEQTLEPGDRYCSDQTTHRVCNYGQWMEDKCDPGSKCFDLDKCPNGPDGLKCEGVPTKKYQIVCYQVNLLSVSQSSSGQSTHVRLRRQADDAAVAVAPESETCDNFKTGDRVCQGDTTHRVCSYGKWYDDQCPAGFKCFDMDNCPNGPEGTKCEKPSGPKQVMCYQLNRIPRHDEQHVDAGSQRSRRQANDAAVAVASESETCDNFKTGDRVCQGDTTHRVCSYGKWYDDQCPAGFKCFDMDNCPNGPEGTKCEKPSGPKQVMCYQLNRIPRHDQQHVDAGSQRSRRQADDAADASAIVAVAPESETCDNFKTGDRVCQGDTTHRVCSYGKWYDDQCPAGFKCFDMDNCPNGPEGTKCEKPSGPKQVMCYQLNRIPRHDQQHVDVGSQRSRRQADDAADATAVVAAAPEGETCDNFKTGDRVCQGDTTHRVCAYGKWYDDQCPAGFKCFDMDNCPNGPEGTTCKKPNGPKQVMCYQLNRIPRHDQQHVDAGSQRSRRQADDAAIAVAVAPTTESDTCTATIKGQQQTLKTGDRYCSADTTHRVCSYGKWYDDKCPEGYKCFQLDDCPNGPEGTKCVKPAEPWRVQCYKLNRGAKYATNDNQNAQAQNDQAQPQPQSQPAPAPAPAPKSSSSSEEHEPVAQPQPQTASGEKTCQGGPSGTMKEAEKICSGKTGYKMCHDGQLLDQQCDPDSECVQSASVTDVICRRIVRNADSDAAKETPKQRLLHRRR